MTNVDTERFGLRHFVDMLVEHGECDVHAAPIDLIDVAGVLDGNEKAVLFTNVGPESAELVGNVMGARSRLALALGTDVDGLAETLRTRLAKPIPPQRTEGTQAPVQQVVLEGDNADLTRLPVHLQHGLDGAPYISASLDFVADPKTGYTNVGCRRMMLRGPRSAGVDLNAPSDLKAIYQGAVERGENLEAAYVVGAHPADFLASVAVTAPMDEFDVLGAVRGSPVPIVKCASVDVWVPADAEYVIEGYFDPRGLVEPEGPYGEYIGYYGATKRNPVFHVTAITHRRDALFQTATIGGKWLGRTDTALLAAAKTEAAVWSALQSAVREPVAVCATTSSGGMYNVRLSLRQRVPGEARNAIHAVMGSIADVKHVFVVDDDIDVHSPDQMDWALATRFQADRDLVVASGFRVVPLDPSLGGSRIGGKAGFDCTKPFGGAGNVEFKIPEPPVLAIRDKASVEETLKAGSATFLDLMAATGSRDGREIVRELDRFYDADRLGRDADGRYVLKE